ncbi:MAG: hypothetical protein Q6L49_00200 [Thermostichales cyanobacterium HHBFW_bins_127]
MGAVLGRVSLIVAAGMVAARRALWMNRVDRFLLNEDGSRESFSPLLGVGS